MSDIEDDVVSDVMSVIDKSKTEIVFIQRCILEKYKQVNIFKEDVVIANEDILKQDLNLTTVKPETDNDVPQEYKDFYSVTRNDKSEVEEYSNEISHEYYEFAPNFLRIRT